MEHNIKDYITDFEGDIFRKHMVEAIYILSKPSWKFWRAKYDVYLDFDSIDHPGWVWHFRTKAEAVLCRDILIKEVFGETKND